MKTVALSVQARDAARSPKQLRRADLVPCVLYGNAVKSTLLQGIHNDLFKAFVKAGESTLVDLDTGTGKPLPVLFHAIDFDPVSEKISHVDFYAVNMKKEIEAHVPLRVVGEAPAIKNLGGSLLTVIDHITVRCLPANLPHAIEVDVSKLENFGESVLVSQLPVPDGVTVMEAPDQQVVSAHAPRKEEVVEAAPAAAEGEAAAGEAAAEGEAKPGEGETAAAPGKAAGSPAIAKKAAAGEGKAADKGKKA